MTNVCPPHGIRPDGFRLPDPTRLGSVHLQVSDLQRSVDYYAQVIGLRVVLRGTNTAILAAHGDERPLVHLQTRPGVRHARRGALGLYHFAILLPDREALGQFATHLATVGVRFGSADHLVSEALYLNDPDDLGIEVYADRPPSAWRVRDRELEMGTEPLDLVGLSAPGGARAWGGAPAGTTVGHVHLHVGDLAEARRFYHSALGFDVTVWTYPGALFFSAGGYHHHLGTNTWVQGTVPSDVHARLLDWELLVPAQSDADAAAQSLQAAGYRAHREGATWKFEDPWGTALTLRAGLD